VSDQGRPAALAGLPLLEDLGDLQGAKVLVRADFNVPITEVEGRRVIVDDFRIRATLPTLTWLLEHGAEVSVCSHLGRPKGAPDERYSMAPVQAMLAKLLPEVTVLENVRFNPGEETAAQAWIDELCAGYTHFVNDAFGCSHRAHASIVGPPSKMPSAAGRLVAREVEVLGGLLHEPARPFVAIVGGAKVADKLGILETLAAKVDTLIVGGAMAFTFLAAQGHKVGASLLDPTKIDACRQLLNQDLEILLPSDIVALEPGAPFGVEFNGTNPTATVTTYGEDLALGWVGLDVGPASVARFDTAIASAKTILWNGPVGAFEDDRFAAGTAGVAASVARSDGFSVIGGGDSAAALKKAGLDGEVDFMSTGGGASLEFIELGDLPGLAALRAATNAPR
jgi:phosphoglycerate kinase